MPQLMALTPRLLVTAPVAVAVLSLRAASAVRLRHSGVNDDVDFGFRRVAASEKPKLVGSVFSSVAASYDVMNDLMSAGVHRLWKRTLIDRIQPARNTRLLDVAGGTGDIAIRFLNRVRDVHGSLTKAHVHVVDACPEMAGECVRRMAQCGFLSSDDMHRFGEAESTVSSSKFETGTKIMADNCSRTPHKAADVSVGDAEALVSVEDSSFDVYTIAFGIRNCTNINNVLREAYRVLKPGGKIHILEFGKVDNAIVSNLYDTYSFQVIPHIGHIVTGDRDAYQYLVESIAKFPKQRELVEMIKHAGFSVHGEGYENLTFGVATIWTGWKV